MSSRSLSPKIAVTVVAVVAVVSVLHFQKDQYDFVNRSDKDQVANQAISLDTKRIIEVSTQSSDDSMAGSLPLSPSPIELLNSRKEGDVIHEWGDFVKFQRVATNCRHVTKTLKRDNDHEVDTQWQCDTKTVADHPYGQMTNAQLEQIADTDGEAALILGVRLGFHTLDVDQYKRGTRYLHTAVLLTGETQAYETLMAQQNIALGISYSGDKADSDENSKAYVWARAGQQLGFFDENDISLTRKGVLVDEQLDIEKLDEMATLLAQQFNEQRQSLIGETFK